MCLSGRISVEIDQIKCYKLFSINVDGKLQSAFKYSYDPDLFYTPDQKIESSEASSFFSFEKKEDALKVAEQNTRVWRLVHSNVIVLPVTIYNVVAKGYIPTEDNDPQTMPYHYVAYESKGIVVHDNPQIRKDFYLEMISRLFKNLRYSSHFSELQKIAFSHVCPELSPLFKEK